MASPWDRTQLSTTNATLAASAATFSEQETTIQLGGGSGDDRYGPHTGRKSLTNNFANDKTRLTEYTHAFRLKTRAALDQEKRLSSLIRPVFTVR